MEKPDELIAAERYFERCFPTRKPDSFDTLMCYEVVDALVCPLESLAECAGHLFETEEFVKDWYQSAQSVLQERCATDETHCGCVPVLRAALADAKRQRDSAYDALRKIRDNLTLCITDDACVTEALRVAESVVGEMQDDERSMRGE